jgi:hypothetical protein
MSISWVIWHSSLWAHHPLEHFAHAPPRSVKRLDAISATYPSDKVLSEAERAKLGFSLARNIARAAR